MPAREPRPDRSSQRPARPESFRPPLRLMTTTLWEYPSQHYDSWVSERGEVVRSKRTGHGHAPGTAMQGDKGYVGATPSWVIWQLLTRYTRAGDTVLDPMCGSGTTLDVCADLERRGVGFDLAPSRPDIKKADARRLPLPDASVDFFFLDPPYSTHVDYSDDPACIGKLDATADEGAEAYYDAMGDVFNEAYRVLKDRRYLGVYVSDSFRKRKPGGVFAPIGFRLFAMLAQGFEPVDVVCVVRQNRKLEKGNWHKAAEEGNFFLRGFNYMMIFKKHEAEPDPAPPRHDRPSRNSKR